MNMPKRIDMTPKEIDALLERVKNSCLKEGDYEIIKAMADTINVLSQVSDERAASIKKLLGMLFGSKTEKKENVVKPSDEKSDKDKKTTGKKKRKGHGRNGATDYPGAQKIKISHESLEHKDRCPKCEKGKVYRQKLPGQVVRVTGETPLTARVYEIERLRCNLCGEIFTAKTPEDIGNEKYDAKAGAMIGLLKYGSGLPFNRMESLHNCLGVPLPSATQWEIVESVSEKLYPVYEQLIREAAQGNVIHNDDTTVKILSLMKNKSERKGLFTTGMISTINDLKIALFFSGQKHAGENMAMLLEKRDADLSLPIQMCDALSRNFSPEFKAILANCLVHARRNFVDVYSSFPEECTHVIEAIADVYKNEKVAKKEKMTSEQRLQYHQIHSGLIMDELYIWLNDQVSTNKVEPNSGLGKAMAYMLRHWLELTLFLRKAGAPLDNNICERALKKSILHRKNALFYKSPKGAQVGDLFMSFIHTCNLNKINPFNYLTELQNHSDKAAANPGKWMPWNYLDVLFDIENPAQ